MFIKFCGFTRAGDVAAAVRLPISAIGFVFHHESPRYVSPEKARLLGEPVPAAVRKTGIFVSDRADEIMRIADTAGLDMLQIYDHRLVPALEGFRPLILAHRIGASSDLLTVTRPEGDTLLLLDNHDPISAGGTGQRFDWEPLKAFPLLHRTIIAGGINAANLAELLKKVKPPGIDISSGIEDAPGEKSAEKMETIINIIKEHRHVTTSR